FADRSQLVGSLVELIHWDAGDLENCVRRVAGEVFLHQLEHAARMLERKIVSRIGRQSWGRRRGGWLSANGHDFGRRWRRCSFGGRCRRGRAVTGGNRRSGGTGHVPTFFVIPGGNVILPGGRIEAGEQPVVGKFESLLDDEGRVGVIGNVFLGVAVVLDGVV